MNPRNKIIVSVYLFLFLAGLYTLLTSSRIDSFDGTTMYKVADSIASGKGGAISVQPRTEDAIGPWGETVPASEFEGGDGYGKWGINGRYYGKYGLGLSIAVIPFIRTAQLISNFIPTITADYAGQSAMVWLNALITAATCVVLFALLIQFYTPALSVKLAILYGLGTIAFYYAKSAFSEPLATLLLLLALFAVSRNRYWLAGLSLGGMLLVRQTTALLALPVALWALFLVWRNEPKALVHRAFALITPIVLGQAIIWVYNIYRFGNWMEYGYGTVRWDTPLALGLYSQLFSSGKGLLVFSPILLTGIWGWPSFRKHMSWAVLILVLVTLWLVAHSLYFDWGGGGGWGPRLLLPIIPLFFLPAGETFERWSKHTQGRIGLAFLIVVSLFFQILGVSASWASHLQRVYDSSADPVQYFQRIHYNWPDSPLLGQLISIKTDISFITSPSVREVLQSFVAQTKGSHPLDWQTTAISLLSLNVPDFWFVYAFFLEIMPLWLLFTLITGLVGLTLWSALKLRGALAGVLPV